MNNNELIKNTNIIKFANRINKNSQLETIPVITEHFSSQNDCYNNVDQKVKKDGGKIIYGWIIHIHYGANNSISFIEAEAHAIWENSNKNKICVSPQPYQNIIFLEDKIQIVKHNITIPNYRMSLLGNHADMKLYELIDHIKIENSKYIKNNSIKKKSTIDFNKIFSEIINFQNTPLNLRLTTKEFVIELSKKLNYTCKYVIMEKN